MRIHHVLYMYNINIVLNDKLIVECIVGEFVVKTILVHYGGLVWGCAAQHEVRHRATIRTLDYNT